MIVESASAYAESVDNVMIFICVVSVVMLLLAAIPMIYFAIRYERKKNPKAEQIEGNVTLEILWIVIPTILVMFMFYYGYADFVNLRSTSNIDLKIKVTAKQWVWDFQYPNGKKADTCYIPLGKTVKFELASADVLHSFFLPGFRIKEDVVPNVPTYVIITPRVPGVYDVPCAEYCGRDHSMMYTTLHVVPVDEYNTWLNKGMPAAAPIDSTKKAN